MKTWHWLALGAGAFILLKDDIAKAFNPPKGTPIVPIGGAITTLERSQTYEIIGTANPPTFFKPFMGEINGNRTVGVIQGPTFRLVVQVVNPTIMSIGTFLDEETPFMQVFDIRKL